MIPLCSSIEDGSNLSASVFTQSSDCCIRAGLQIWWGCHSPSKKIFFFLSCVRDRRIKEPFHFVVENETGYDDRRDSVLLQSDNRAHAVEALFCPIVLSTRDLVCLCTTLQFFCMSPTGLRQGVRQKGARAYPLSAMRYPSRLPEERSLYNVEFLKYLES